MRLRKWRPRSKRSAKRADSETEVVRENLKVAEPVAATASGLIRKIISSPDFPVQMMMVILTLSSGHVQMDRKIDTMSTTVETVRNITSVLTNTMQSLKVAADAPQQIRRMLQ
jgi:hypothetical protein